MPEIQPTLKPIFLTFDDGPNEPFTSQVLDVLREHDIKASFFVCGQNLSRFPEIAKRIVRENHAIGNHTYSHSRFKTLLGRLKGEIIKTDELIAKTTGVTTRLFRPPWGILMPWLKPFLQAQNYSTFFWDIAAYDWRQPSADYIANRVIKKAKPNAIILLHDGNQTFGGNRSQTVLALPKIITELKNRGYTFSRLGD